LKEVESEANDASDYETSGPDSTQPKSASILSSTAAPTIRKRRSKRRRRRGAKANKAYIEEALNESNGTLKKIKSAKKPPQVGQQGAISSAESDLEEGALSESDDEHIADRQPEQSSSKIQIPDHVVFAADQHVTLAGERSEASVKRTGDSTTESDTSRKQSNSEEISSKTKHSPETSPSGIVSKELSEPKTQLPSEAAIAFNTESDSNADDILESVITAWTQSTIPKELNKYWRHRYSLFSLFDEGIRMDHGKQ
jgi:hypothetical protein